ncbi:ABC transporter permease [Niallia sp. SS-2023]|uniref:ABC transporter permease n=1 Tax=Niallia sp. SS-2023 TaxID=3051155 RepID=UPI002549D060|nr:ABC transporter permease [Niallia sp. SS-2023]MDL0437652.1 ABC transporter permease [Niallia sp. SS-2023]
MNINQLIFRNLVKNIKHYYLYVFALIFSVCLYFAFVTLQYDPSMDSVEGTIKGGAAIKVASILLVVIVSIFLFYANMIFIKRRSKEIGLFQLIGMTKEKIFWLLGMENFLLYFGALFIGTFIGFSFSKLIILVLFKITGVKGIAKLHFSNEALVQTILVFAVIYIFIMLMNYIFIKRQTILNLFRVTSSAEGRVKKMSVMEIIIGIIGIAGIISGYYVSSKLFDGDFQTMNALFGAMAFILGSVILGTYLFYKGSVSFLFNLVRKSKNGYLNINEVLSLSSIMFKMKSNSLLLTIITTVSALAIALLSLCYISYYSAEKNAETSIPANFSFGSSEEAALFTEQLTKNKIAYDETKIDVIMADINIGKILKADFNNLNFDPNMTTLAVVSENSVKGVDLEEDEALFTNYDGALKEFMPMKNTGDITLETKDEAIPLHLIGLDDVPVISYKYTAGGMPTTIVDEKVFAQLNSNKNDKLQLASSTYFGVDINKNAEIEKANDIYHDLKLEEQEFSLSRLDMATNNKSNMGLTMFIVGFLGLTFLITSGCILYFKQMDEGEEEKHNYTILRKLGYTKGDLIRGIQGKQLFSFGIPLVIGLAHSYFAVQSGWFFFGTAWTPMLTVMVVYTLLYSIFGLLSVLYYKKVINNAL